VASNSGKKPAPRGFAGLDSLVSDVEKDIADAKRAPVSLTSGPGAPPSAQTRLQNEASDGARHESRLLATKPGGDSQAVWWVVIGVVAILAWIGSTREDKTSPPVAVSPTNAPGKTESSPSIWDEVKPPEGTDRVLSFAELRYCVAEDIRLQAMDGVIDRYRDYEVDGFNKFVSDYNSRCGSFKYRTGSLQSVQSNAVNRRGGFEEEGRLRALTLRAPDKATKPPRLGAPTAPSVVATRPQ
jgi:hypothetical protein